MEKGTVAVKKTTATVLREAARVIREEEKQIERVKNLISGGVDFARYEELEEQARAAEEVNALRDIQKKHLLGLLSREEAILARHNVLLANKTKRAQIDKERQEINEIIKQTTLEQNAKIKEYVEKAQQIQKNIVEQKKCILNKKIKEAQELADSSRQLYEEATLKRKEELMAKMQIIKQIKELSSLKNVNRNRFDPTETMNWGLLCEMSLNELQERLQLKKASLEEEIENRKRYITDKKNKQQKYFMDIQQFIDDCREQKRQLNIMAGSKPKIRQPTESQDIIELREKLQRAKSKRQQLQK